MAPNLRRSGILGYLLPRCDGRPVILRILSALGEKRVAFFDENRITKFRIGLRFEDAIKDAESFLWTLESIQKAGLSKPGAQGKRAARLDHLFEDFDGFLHFGRVERTRHGLGGKKDGLLSQRRVREFLGDDAELAPGTEIIAPPVKRLPQFHSHLRFEPRVRILR